MVQAQELIREIDVNNHDDFLNNSNHIVVLHFFSDWKMDCLMSIPVVESLAEEFLDKIFFGKVNVEESEDIAGKYGIEKVPCVLILKNKKVVEKITNCEEIFLREKIEELI